MSSYSRSFLFGFLNGTQQTEAVNGFKDQLFGFHIQPRHALKRTVNYHLRQEHPDMVLYPNGVRAGAPSNLPKIQGERFQPLRPGLTRTLYIPLRSSPWLQEILRGSW